MGLELNFLFPYYSRPYGQLYLRFEHGKHIALKPMPIVVDIDNQNINGLEYHRYEDSQVYIACLSGLHNGI